MKQTVRKTAGLNGKFQNLKNNFNYYTKKSSVTDRAFFLYVGHDIKLTG